MKPGYVRWILAIINEAYINSTIHKKISNEHAEIYELQFG